MDASGFEVDVPPAEPECLAAIEEITIRLAGRVGCLVGDDSKDIGLALEIARTVIGSETEGQALCDYAVERATSLIAKASRIGLIDKLVDRLEESGVIDLEHEPRRDFAPLFEIRQAPITVNLPAQPAPVVNVTLPQQDPPVVNVEAPNKVVMFERDYDGNIVEAVTETSLTPRRSISICAQVLLVASEQQYRVAPNRGTRQLP